MSPVIRFGCGHVGRTADKASGFILVAEIRQAKVIESPKPCPLCKHRQTADD